MLICGFVEVIRAEIECAVWNYASCATDSQRMSSCVHNFVLIAFGEHSVFVCIPPLLNHHKIETQRIFKEVMYCLSAFKKEVT